MTSPHSHRNLATLLSGDQRSRLARRSLRGKLKGEYPKDSWNAFVDKFYDGGDKLVANPNPKGRSDKVRFNTAYKNKDFRSKMNKQFEKYLDSLDDDNESKSQKAKPLSDLSKDVQDAMGKLSPAKRKRVLQRALHEEESGAKSRTEFLDMPEDVRESMSELSSTQRRKVLERALQQTKTAQLNPSAKRLLREARNLLPEDPSSRQRKAGWQGALTSFKKEPRFDVEIVPGEGIRLDLEEVPPVLWADNRRQAISWLNGVARRALRAIKTLQRAER